MPSTRRMILGHVMSGVCYKMNRTKQLPNDIMETPMNRCLSTLDITLLGIGHMVGAGIYVLTGTVAKDIAGPAIILSFLLAAFVSVLAALCYAEFGTRVPKAGSAYIYTYVSIGEFWAFVIGWNILLEHMLGAASVARAWSGYVDSLLGGFIANTTISLTGEMHEHLLAQYPDFLAFFVCIAYAAALGTGVKTTAVINGVLTIVNVFIVIMVISIGFWYANPRNWTTANHGGGFLPFGVSGIIAGAASCFYAFVGFDSIATSGEEARNPTQSIPLATILSLGIVTVAYVLVSAALTLMIPYNEINPAAALSDAFGSIGLPWAKYIISIGALCGMTTTLLGSLYALPRCLYAMSTDGLIFSFFGRINEQTQVPMFNLIVSGVMSAMLALLFDLEKLVEFMSIGTLLAYTIVSASVIVLRYRPPTVEEAVTYAPTIIDQSISDGGGGGGGGVTTATVVSTRRRQKNQDESDDDDDDDDDSSSSSSTSSHQSNSFVSAGTATSAVSGTGGGTEGGGNIGTSEIALAGKLRPQYRWLEPFIGRCKPGSAVSVAVFIYTALCVAVCFQFEMYWDHLYKGDWISLITYGVFIFFMVTCVIIMAAHHQNTRNIQFKVPFVPYIPALSILFNIELMIHLSATTWIRFFVWIVIGMLMYFCYGIHHSKEGTLGSSYSILLASSEAKRGSLGSLGDCSGSRGSGGGGGGGGSGGSGNNKTATITTRGTWSTNAKSSINNAFSWMGGGSSSRFGSRRKPEDKTAIIIEEDDS